MGQQRRAAGAQGMGTVATLLGGAVGRVGTQGYPLCSQGAGGWSRGSAESRADAEPRPRDQLSWDVEGEGQHPQPGPGTAGEGAVGLSTPFMAPR